ncbi:efflux RND transporter periplasmic adaptor subunit [uncultured Desulfosarcina sp.]|uniref:efflux RND transporter periplasmic adaptor subunit n=1 Tax=uncultured Desulfosarcina sp. TaxID=218289 RepID=UPI0029C732C5|nr:efflux RND transporter periplasmic adaptor subunit [uncultured Desulfosarcina sp.]
MKRKRKGRWAALAITLAGCAVAALLAAMDEEAPDIAIDRPVLAVETIRVQKADYRIRVPAWGFVKPRETIDIRTQVSGRVDRVSAKVFTGARVNRGEFLFSIDVRDYRNALVEATAAYETARQALAIEEGRQTVARSEWKLLEQSPWAGERNKALALREPQRKACRADVQAALAKQSRAARDVERTRIASPCKGVILSETIAEGDVMDRGDVALRVACTERYQILAAFSPQYRLDPKARTAVIEIGTDRHDGVIKAVLPRIDPQTRQKQVLMAFAGQGVMLDAYASLTLPGPFFEDAVILPVEALRQGSSVWVLGADGTLVIREVTILARDLSHIVVGNGLMENDRVILTHIASPLQGMPLRQASLNRKG